MATQSGHIDRSAGYAQPVCGCGDRRTAEAQYSFGAYAGIYCDRCWPLSGYRDAVTPTHLCEPCDEPLDED